MMAVIPEGSAAGFSQLVSELCKLTAETRWVEFKHNNGDAEMIGRTISSLANGAALEGKNFAYILWGIEDGTQRVIGIDFEPLTATRGNEPLATWLATQSLPRLDVSFSEGAVGGHRVVMLRIPAASNQPASFVGIRYVRIGPTNRALKEYPTIEAKLWQCFNRQPFERRVIEDRLSEIEVLELLDVSTYFALLKVRSPDGHSATLNALSSDGLVVRGDDGRWGITALGAILFASRLEAFPTIERKALRVIRYTGDSRVDGMSEQVGKKGYASGFEGLISFIKPSLPTAERLIGPIRSTDEAFPEISIRELISNALVHQDLTITGAGPMIEIFTNRVEVTNPGEPLIDPHRFLDSPPRSRNEAMAALLRRAGICEERGSGVDRVVAIAEDLLLPAPSFRLAEGSVVATLLSPRELTRMAKEDRVRAVYLHACLRFVSSKEMTNTFIRQRFAISDRNAAQASRLINEARDADLVRPHDAAAGKRNMRYVPHWA